MKSTSLTPRNNATPGYRRFKRYVARNSKVMSTTRISTGASAGIMKECSITTAGQSATGFPLTRNGVSSCWPASGRSSSTTTSLARCCKRHSGSHVSAARVTQRLRPCRTTMARRRFTSVQNDLET